MVNRSSKIEIKQEENDKKAESGGGRDQGKERRVAKNLSGVCITQPNNPDRIIVSRIDAFSNQELNECKFNLNAYCAIQTVEAGMYMCAWIKVFNEIEIMSTIFWHVCLKCHTNANQRKTRTALFWLACVGIQISDSFLFLGHLSRPQRGCVMPHTQQIHAGDPAYASPVIRPPSPASSVGTAYGPDDTSLSDSELSQDDFERKAIANLRLDEPKHDEVHNLKDPLIICPSDPQEQKRVLNFTLVSLVSLLIPPASAV